MTSDHFHPWWHDNAFGNFTWIWIASAAERTKEMQFVTGVTAPIHRYHPAIIAQAFASLSVLYPNRIGLGLGTGEAMNELPLGFSWPKASVRLDRMKESIKIIRSMWNGLGGRGIDVQKGAAVIPKQVSTGVKIDPDRFVSYEETYYQLRKAKLYTPPSHYIPLYVAAAAKNSTKLAAEYSDGIITFLKPDKAKSLLDLFDKTAKSKGRNSDSLEKVVEYKVSYDGDYEKALQSCMFWRATMIKNVFNSKISDPRKLEEKARKEVSEEAVKESIQVTTSIEDCIKPIEQYAKAGFTRIYVHSTSPDESKFIEAFSKRVMPHFRK